MTEPLRQIVVAGGGSAGWMSAAALIYQLRGSGIAVTLVESDEIGRVGVGEATIPPILAFNRMLGIPEPEFVRATNGTFKIGIEFVDWFRKGERYFHPFGRYGDDFGLVPFHQQWLAARARGAAEPLSAYSLTHAAASLARFGIPTGNGSSNYWTFGYAYHFDAEFYARFLRKLSEGRGVVRKEGKIIEVQRDAVSGRISALLLNTGERIAGDLFIDCTGFRGLLIGETLGSEYLDFRHWLPCDRAVAVPCARTEPLLPYTRATARDFGWQWRIPLQHRIGNGLVYCSGFAEAAEAERVLLDNLDGERLSEPRHLSFVTGRRRHMWVGNVVAIGLASGFLEPLESTSLHLVQSAIMQLIAHFPDKAFNPRVTERYNRKTAAEFDAVRDFLILHYSATERRDSAFWRHCAAIDRPDSLQEAIAIFQETGRLFIGEYDIFHEASWLAVLMGQGVIPNGRDFLADAVPEGRRRDILAAIRRLIADEAGGMSGHADFVKGLIAAHAAR
jgi:tryptophan 7-halogenase